MLSRPIANSFILLKHNFVLHESYIEKYAYDNDFQYVYASLRQGNQIEELDYHVHNSLLYDLGKLCILKGERNDIIREMHTSLIAGHFGVGKAVVNLQRYCYWPHMFDNVSHFIRGCSLCARSMQEVSLAIGNYDCTLHFWYLDIQGRVSQWIL